MRLIDIEDEALLAELREKQDACKEMIDNATEDDPTWTEREHWEGVYGSFVEMALTIKAAPTVDAELVRHERWEQVDGRYRCTYCKTPTWYGIYNYCPNCGAKMDEGEEDG